MSRALPDPGMKPAWITFREMTRPKSILAGGHGEARAMMVLMAIPAPGEAGHPR